MTSIRISIQPTGEASGESVEIETLDVRTALTVADINIGHGRAELHDGDRLLARLVKHGGDAATFWRVG